ncbi:leucine-rich PPR motif-containing protein, mitochondrial-like [Anneissia japonica]|uniref:leucine-rich PPR motif-containing protein, mitochondrial-like n=1 Tax=Anneissia japonica TaxID=1529436 RepID=UPI0014259277|nr:leucine-rich PPR motif-containing protein, mitochondrial-like [Anneissia japonica]
MASFLLRLGRLMPQTTQVTTRYCRRSAILETQLMKHGHELSVFRSQFLSTSACCQQFSTSFNSHKPENDFRRILKRLDDAVRATGRITQNQLTAVFSEVCKMKVATPNQALLLIRSCGSLLPEMPLEKRSELAHKIWEKLAQLGTLYDVSHYNALLRVYLQNEHKFQPTDFLANMEAKGIEPNRVTYQRLIAAYCQMGDIDGATKILEFMKSKDLPITEGVFNSLIEGHAKAGNMESAKEIPDLMRNVGLEPSFETYSNLLCAYAIKGDMAALESTLEELKAISITIPDKVYLNVIDKLACNGYGSEVPKILENVKFIGGFLQEAINLIISLLTKGHDESAFAIVRLFKSLTNDTAAFPGQDINRCNFLIDHLVQMKMPLDKMCMYMEELQELGLHQSPYILGLQCSLRRGLEYRDYSLSILETIHKKNIPIRGLYFYPLMALEANQKNNSGILKLFKMAVDMNATMSSDIFKMYILPAIQGTTDEIIQQLKDSGAVLDDTLLTAVCRQESSKGNLASVYKIVEDNPDLDVAAFRTNIHEGFIK